MNKLLLGAVALPSISIAACWQTPELETRTFALEYIHQDEAAQLVDPYVFYDREQPPGPGSMSGVPGALTVRETEDNLERIELVLREFDRQREDLRIRFQLIEADGFTNSDAEIRDVVEELEDLFRFDGYRLMAEAVVTTALSSSFRQEIAGTETPFEISGSVVPGAGQSVIVRTDLSSPWGNVLESSVTVTSGQTVILGSGRHHSADGGRDGTVILVMRVGAAP